MDSKELTTNKGNFNSNPHLKNDHYQSFHVNTQVLDTPLYELKFNKLANPKEQNVPNPRFLKKSKFNWQINEFNK